jgi:DNA-binding Lrp family transcriptional regulator
LGGLRKNDLVEILDAVDARILDLIQHDAALSVADIAERVGLSSSPCWRRIKRLEDVGVIRRRVTLLDREQLGLAFEVYAEVKLSLPTKENLEAFEHAISNLPEVIRSVKNSTTVPLGLVAPHLNDVDA